jgi:dipeptidyl-peptidase-4
MWLPDENREGYDAGRVMTYASNLKGRLLLYYGTAVATCTSNSSSSFAPSNRREELRGQVGPDLPHGSVNNQRMMEFFIDNLVVQRTQGTPVSVPGSDD